MSNGKHAGLVSWPDITRYIDTYGGSYTYGRREHLDDDTFRSLCEEAKTHGLQVIVSPGGNVHIQRST